MRPVRNASLLFAFALGLAGCAPAPVAPDVVTSPDVVDAANLAPDAVNSDPDVIDEPWVRPASCLDAASSPDPPDVATADSGGSPDATDATDASVPGDVSASVSGHAMGFTTSGGLISGAYVTVLEHPERCTRTNESGYFRLDGFAPGEDVSLVMNDPLHPLIQTSTERVARGGLTQLGFQAPDYPMYSLLQVVTHARARPGLCQIATTVMEVGFMDYDNTGPSHGEAGAIVTIDPPVAVDSGPIYFQWLAPGRIVPDRTLTETSRDGGVLFLNVPPGDYVIDARKAGVTFRPVRIRCRAGLIVNASPPWGIQAM